MSFKDEKIIQVIPAPEGMFATYDDEGKKISSKVICIALTNHGQVMIMDADNSGLVEDVMEAVNFNGFEYK